MTTTNMNYNNDITSINTKIKNDNNNTNITDIKQINTTGRNNCGGRCVLCAHVSNNQIIKMTPADPSTYFHGDVALNKPCIRGLNYHTTYINDNRLKYPMKRIGKRGEGLFERISWEEAIDIISKEWIRIRDTYGPGSRYVNYATGVSALLTPNRFAKRLLSLDGGFLDYYNSYSSACIHQATKLMYGTTMTGNSLPDLVNSKYIILWGHNPSETKFDSETMYYLKEARKNGTPIIIIDPRKSDTAYELDATWIPIRPATDAALADAMAYVIYTNNLHNQEFLDKCCIGFDKSHMSDGVDHSECYLSYLLGENDGIPKTPEWASTITGVPADVITNLATDYATIKPAALIEGYGAQRNALGEQAIRGGILLACMTGNVGISGGWASGSGNCTYHNQPEFPSVTNPYQMQIPSYRWTDAVTHGHEMTSINGVIGGNKLKSDIKMILNLAGNCLINQHGDINRTKEILADTNKCEFIVCSEIFMTSSAKYADILLPGISMLECENITMPWHYGDFLGFSNKIIEPLYEGRFEYDWLSEVAERLGLKDEFTEGKSISDWLKSCYENLRQKEQELPDYDSFKKAAFYQYQNTPSIIAFEKECQNPEAYPFPTPSGKIEIFSKKVYESTFEEFFPPIPRYVKAPEGFDDELSSKYPLQLIGWHSKRRCNSIHDNNDKLHPIDPQMLWINPSDAAKRNIKDKDIVCIYNDRGQIQIPAFITDRIMSGVIALSQGAWYNPDTNGIDTAGSINVLTSLKTTPYARGNGQHTNLVEVTKI